MIIINENNILRELKNFQFVETEEKDGYNVLLANVKICLIMPVSIFSSKIENVDNKPFIRVVPCDTVMATFDKFVGKRKFADRYFTLLDENGSCKLRLKTYRDRIQTHGLEHIGHGNRVSIACEVYKVWKTDGVFGLSLFIKNIFI